MAEIEAHDEVVEWFDELSQNEWERASVVVDRLASLGSKARMPFSRSLGDGLFEVRFTLAPLPDGSRIGSPKTIGSFS